MLVLDASVALKWFLSGETNSAAATQLLQEHRQGQNEIAVPDLMAYEIGNVLVWKKTVKTEEISNAISELFFLNLDVRPFESVDHLGTIELARQYQISVYDAAYVYLAEKLNCALITADEKLYEKTKSLPFVRLLIGSPPA